MVKKIKSFKDLELVSKRTQKAYEAAFSELLLRVLREAIKNAPSDRGLLAASLSIDRTMPTKATVGTNLVYAEAMEKGTKPFTPPFEAIAKWARRKGIPDEFITRIWLSIRAKGIKPHPYLIPAAEKEILKWDLILQKHLKDKLEGFI